MSKNMSFSAAGDSLIVRRLPAGYTGRQELKEFIGKAEARITNLETTLTKGIASPTAFPAAVGLRRIRRRQGRYWCT